MRNFFQKEKTIEQELQWAQHLNLPAVILPSLSPPFENYARMIFRSVAKMNFGQLWLRIPILLDNVHFSFLFGNLSISISLNQQMIK